MARILLLTLVFAPDGASTAVLMTELALELQALGHQVTVLTTTPHYNLDTEARQRQPLRQRWGGLLYESDYQGIPVYHARVSPKGQRLAARMLDYARFHLVSSVAGVTLAGACDLIVAPSPPLTIGLNAWFLALAHRAPFLYNVQEIYPDIAVSLGVLRNKIVLRLLTHLERFIYGRARKVIVISDGFRQRLLAKGVPNASLRVIPNHVDTNFIQPGERRNEFSSAHGLDDRFVILYAGNIGFSQDFDTLLDAAGVLAHLSNLRFLIVGDGARKAWLQAELTRRALSNVTLLPYQPRSLVPHMYASSDLCLAPMKRGAAGETFPSKIYTIMAAARPAIVCTEQESDLARLVIEAGCGWVAPPEDGPALTAAILKAYEQRNSPGEMGRNGRAYVLAHHSRQAVAQQYDTLLRELLP